MDTKKIDEEGLTAVVLGVALSEHQVVMIAA
jgi:hypothetical protein